MARFVPNNPGTGEHSSYNRYQYPFFWMVSSFTWKWQFSTDYVPPGGVYPQVRLLVDGLPASAWVSSTDGFYLFSLSGIANGHHVVSAEGTGVEVLQKGFLVNTTGVRLPVQAPWTAVTWFERTHGAGSISGIAPGTAQVTLPIAAPVIFPLKARSIVPYNTILPQNQLWVRRIQANNGATMTHRVVMVPSCPEGDYAIEAEQKFFYSDHTTYGNPSVGLVPPKIRLRDGPRGTGTLGPVYKFAIRELEQGAYFAETDGRLGLLKWDGSVQTLVGWRLKPGVDKAHSGISGVLYMYGKSSANYHPEHQAFYDSKWEHIGDWSRVSGSKFFNELRGFAVAKQKSVSVITIRDGNDFWCADPMHHRILYINNWTAQTLPNYQAAHFPPVGYTPPAAPTGSAQVVTWMGGDGTAPTTYTNNTWGIAFHKTGGKIYWTNFEGNSICRANYDGSNPEFVLQSSVNPTNAQLGVSKRLDDGTAPATLRLSYLIDGPVGVASCVRPQDICINSDGDVVWVERYTYAIRRLVLATGMVTTVGLMDNLLTAGVTSAANDISMQIDVEGSCGPQDDVFVAAWRADYRYSKSGTFRGHWAFASGAIMRNGPLNRCDTPDYAWGVGVGEGRIIFLGSAAGWQCIEITKRLPTDVEPDFVQWDTGNTAYSLNAPMYLQHGPHGQGELGRPYIDQLGSYDDATLRAYLLANGFTTANVASVMYWVRENNRDHDFSGIIVVPPPDTTPPAAPTQALTVNSTLVGGAYNLTFSGVAGPEADITEVRVYVDGGSAIETDVGPNQAFSVPATYPAAQNVVIDYTRVQRGGDWYKQKKWLLHGPYVNGFINTTRPWGENADGDYFIEHGAGFTPP